MESSEIRERFLKFFEKRGHKIIPSASLVPENDPSVLFNTAGMQPLVPYLLGQEHPMGKRIVDVQKCVRTGDLDDIGDSRHFSFFEMMGNWSLGDYFKEEAIKWSYEFLTSKDEGLGLDAKRLYVTVFEGDENAPKDTESALIWKSLGIPENRIYFLGAEDNWWAAGDNGPCGPDTEMFYDMSGTVGDLTPEQFLEAVKKEDVIEIWNDVFMEYEKKDGKVIGKLKQRNVDTGAGLERITAVMQGKQTAYDTDLLSSVMLLIKENSEKYNEKSGRIITDHVRTSIFMIADGVLPGNKDQGYVLRRLVRRAVVQADAIELNDIFPDLIAKFIDLYKNFYPTVDNKDISVIFLAEVQKFLQTLKEGIAIFEKALLGFDKSELYNALTDKNLFPAEISFKLESTYGIPFEVLEELIKQKGKVMDTEGHLKLRKEHQKLSQTASAGMFKGGLANHNEKTIKLHTAHHLLLAGLQAVVDKNIKQRGSNITEERLRIDFLCDHKLTDEEKKKVEDWVNDKITQGLDVVRREMPLIEAQNLGAEMEFGAKYPDTVSVYFIEDKNGNAVSKEFCGGPHVKNTAELDFSSREHSRDHGPFKIQKEEAVAQGIRRIKAVLA